MIPLSTYDILKRKVTVIAYEMLRFRKDESLDDDGPMQLEVSRRDGKSEQLLGVTKKSWLTTHSSVS